MIKLVMCLGVFPIELVATNFTDVNECADGTSNCSADAVCINTKGSYRCKCKTSSPSKAADSFVFLEVMYFIKIVNLKDGQFLLLNNPYQNGMMLLLHGQENCRKIARLLRHRIQLESPVSVYTLFLKLHQF